MLTSYALYIRVKSVLLMWSSLKTTAQTMTQTIYLTVSATQTAAWQSRSEVRK
jgi:hypothetical protein